jgi:hypothetical protein
LQHPSRLRADCRLFQLNLRIRGANPLAMIGLLGRLKSWGVHESAVWPVCPKSATGHRGRNDGASESSIMRKPANLGGIFVPDRTIRTPVASRPEFTRCASANHHTSGRIFERAAGEDKFEINGVRPLLRRHSSQLGVNILSKIRISPDFVWNFGTSHPKRSPRPCTRRGH